MFSILLSINVFYLSLLYFATEHSHQPRQPDACTTSENGPKAVDSVATEADSSIEKNGDTLKPEKPARATSPGNCKQSPILCSTRGNKMEEGVRMNLAVWIIIVVEIPNFLLAVAGLFLFRRKRSVATVLVLVGGICRGIVASGDLLFLRPSAPFFIGAGNNLGQLIYWIQVSNAAAALALLFVALGLLAVALTGPKN
jgi:hypothetical protein